MTTEQTIVMRRLVEMRHAAISYGITRIADFSNGGEDLTSSEQAALRALLAAAEGTSE